MNAFNPTEFVERATESIRKQIGEGSAIAACSGGVDSTVCAELGRRAIGDRLTAVFIDDGMRREGEPEDVVSLLKSMGFRTVASRAGERFFESLKGVDDAESKRKAFRETFYSTLAEAARNLGAGFLIQGTIAADVMETVSGLKTQHNVLEQVGYDGSKHGFTVLEPLVDLFKPQVRELARELNLPSRVSERMPFPGPGLAIRVVGEVTPDRVRVVRRATRIVEDETSEMGAFQAFAVLIPCKATGVREGRRTYGDIVAIRVVESQDAMSAKTMAAPMNDLRRIANRITSEIDEVSRCVYDVTDKPPATIEYE